jgi:hypothetical protein
MITIKNTVRINWFPLAIANLDPIKPPTALHTAIGRATDQIIAVSYTHLRAHET